MMLFEPNKEVQEIKSLPRPVYDVTGAGDTVLATLALAFISGASVREAVELANLAAGRVVLWNHGAERLTGINGAGDLLVTDTGETLAVQRVEDTGVSEPVFGQRKISEDLRVKDGEVALIGGVTKQQDDLTVTGIPGLSKIPFFGKLFSGRSTDLPISFL